MLTEKDLKWVGVDFDKTIANNSGHPDYEITEPMEGAWAGLTYLEAQGYKTIIYTARPWTEYEIIEKWMNENRLPFRRIVCGKVFVKYMIDDRAIEHVNWDKTIKRLIEREDE